MHIWFPAHILPKLIHRFVQALIPIRVLKSSIQASFAMSFLVLLSKRFPLRLSHCITTLDFLFGIASIIFTGASVQGASVSVSLLETGEE